METDYRSIVDTLDAGIVASAIAQFGRADIRDVSSMTERLFERTHEGRAAWAMLVASYEEQHPKSTKGEAHSILVLQEPPVLEQALRYTAGLAEILALPPEERTAEQLRGLSTLAHNMRVTQKKLVRVGDAKPIVVSADRRAWALRQRGRRRRISRAG